MQFTLSFFCLLLIFLPEVYSDTINVCKNCPKNTIHRGLQAAHPHDTLLVASGTYYENDLVVDKPLSILGKGDPIIDADRKGKLFLIQADSVLISGFQLQNMKTSFVEDHAAIKLDRVKHCTIENNTLLDTYFGIYLKNSEKSVVKNNRIQTDAKNEITSGNAIHLWYCEQVLIENNISIGHRDGIYFEFVENSTIRNNRSEDNVRYGLHFMFSNRNIYRNNIFKNNGAGVAVMFSKEIQMTGNRFEKNWGASSYGLLLKEIYDGTIRDNEFIENTIGIFGEGSNRLLITGNEFERNGWALKIMGSCLNNTFTRNNFFGNTFDLATNSYQNLNNYTENYWSEYTGYDLDKDGYGDVPYYPVKLFSYLVTKIETSIILTRSLFIDLLNFAEKVAPSIVPGDVVDNKPLMQPFND